MSKRISKTKTRVLRVELELRSRFLRLYEIYGPYDFGKLVEILPEKHIHFVKFNEKKLVERLRTMGFSREKVGEIMEDVALLEGDAWATLNYLRQELELKNARRFLDPVDTNDQVLDALRAWAALWPAAPDEIESEMSDDGKLLLTVAEVAALTGFSEGTIRHWISQRRIPVVRILARCVRLRRSDIDRWIAERVVEAKAINVQASRRGK